MPNSHDIKVGRSRFDEFAHGICLCDLVEAVVRVDDLLRYREFDFTNGHFTGRTLTYVVRWAMPGPKSGGVDGLTMVSLEPCIDGVGIRELADGYFLARGQRMVPVPKEFVARVISDPEAGIEVLGHLIAIADSTFGRLYPLGETTRWYRLSGGPLATFIVSERELPQHNRLLGLKGQYEPRSSEEAVWVPHTTG